MIAMLTYQASHIKRRRSTKTEVAARRDALLEKGRPVWRRIPRHQQIREPAPQPFEEAPQTEPIIDQPDRRELVGAALQTGGRSNREITRSLNCSEATVRRVATTLSAIPLRLAAPDAPVLLREGRTRRIS